MKIKDEEGMTDGFGVIISENAQHTKEGTGKHYGADLEVEFGSRSRRAQLPEGMSVDQAECFSSKGTLKMSQKGLISFLGVGLQTAWLRGPNLLRLSSIHLQ